MNPHAAIRGTLAAGVLAYGIDATTLITRACLAAASPYSHHPTRDIEHMIQVLLLVAIALPPFAAVSLGMLTDRIRWAAVTGAALAAVVIGAVFLGDTLGGDPMRIHRDAGLAAALFTIQWLVVMMGIGASCGAIGSLIRRAVSCLIAANKSRHATLRGQAP